MLPTSKLTYIQPNVDTVATHSMLKITPPSRLLLNIDEVSMRFGQRVLWEQVNFSIYAGEFVALLGGNGTGKTTMLRSILKLLPITTGRIHLSPNVRIGYVPQLKDFEPKLPIRGRDLVKLGLDGGSYFFGMMNPKKPNGRYWQSNKQKNYLVDRAIAEVGGQGFCDAPLSMLSGGEQQRMRIAQALVSEPDLLMMDEPLLSLDMASQQVVCDILAHRKEAHHTAILMISHELMPITPLIDKVVYIENQRTKVGGKELLESYRKLSS